MPFDMASSKIIGGSWNGKLYFISYDKKDTIHQISETELANGDHLKKYYFEKDERIIYVEAWKKTIFMDQLKFFGIYHAVILFVTSDEHWWSIEKVEDGITLQRSNSWEEVLGCHRAKGRDPVNDLLTFEFMNQDLANSTVLNLLFWLFTKKELKLAYNLVDNNCQKFAKCVFDVLAVNINL